MAEKINFKDFQKLDIRIGIIQSVEKIENADKLLKLEIDFGKDLGKRQIVAGIAEFCNEEDLVGKQIPVVVNLEPRTLRGVESQGMILAVEVDGKPILFNPEEPVPAGSKIR